MLPRKTPKSIDLVLPYLPYAVADEAVSIARSRYGANNGISEIRLRSFGVSALVIGGVNVALRTRVSDTQLKETFRKVSGGAVFAHRDDIARGFISLDRGVRVGVVGHAKYENGTAIGVGDISSLVFRLPSGECSFGKELYAEWLLSGGGMLICSRAGEGKTTAIRTLARLIGTGEIPRRVVVVDERCEFDRDGYSNAHVDILRGYRRVHGVDIAIRTMSAEVLIVDEISSPADARAMMEAMGAGVTVIATAHAQSFADAMKRDYVRELIDGGLFENVCVIKRQDGRFLFNLERIGKRVAKELHGTGDI